MNFGRLIVGYHGCDITTRDNLVTGRTKAKSSKNRYDWLGPGFYFFEGDPERAAAFSRSAFKEPNRRYTAQPIATPAVVGCVLAVQRCLDLTTRMGLAEFEDALPALIEGLVSVGAPVPSNSPSREDDQEVLLRRLDNAVIRLIHDTRDRDHAGIYYEMVRGAFPQGPPLADNSGFHRDGHVQMAVRDSRCMLGWFLLPSDQLLTESEYDAAMRDLADLKEAVRKPRQRAA